MNNTIYSISFKNTPPPIDSIISYTSSRDGVYSPLDTKSTDTREVLQMHFPEDTDMDTLMSIYKSESALSEITITEKYTNALYVYTNYCIPIKLSLEVVGNEEDQKMYGTKRWIMEVGRLTELDIKLRRAFGELVNDNTVMDIDEYKKMIITASKERLSKYLEKNPMEYHGEYYNITNDSQTRFLTRFAIYQAKINSGDTTAKMLWHSSGQLDCEWSYNKCIDFIDAMNSYVNPLVQKQQLYEIDILSIMNKENIDICTQKFNDSLLL